MVRLNITSQTAREVVLAVHGKIVATDLKLLEHEVESYLQRRQQVVLDLEGVPFIDGAGVSWLQTWTGARLALRGGSPFLQALLAGEGIQIESTDKKRL